MTDALMVRASLQATTGSVLYADLAAHLRRSAVFVVPSEAFLLDAATAIAMDDAPTVTALLAAGQLRRPTVEEVQAWAQSVGRVWIAVIVQPFVVIADAADWTA